MLNDKYVGQLDFHPRLHSGVVKSGDTRIELCKGYSRTYRSLGTNDCSADRTEIEEVRAGDIAAAIGLKKTLPLVKPCAESAPIILNAWNSLSR